MFDLLGVGLKEMRVVLELVGFVQFNSSVPPLITLDQSLPFEVGNKESCELRHLPGHMMMG